MWSQTRFCRVSPLHRLSLIHILTAALAQVLEVSPQALDVPDIDRYIGLMHTLFTLEAIYGLTVSEADGEVCLKVNKDKGKDDAEISKMLCAWKEQEMCIRDSSTTSIIIFFI